MVRGGRLRVVGWKVEDGEGERLRMVCVRVCVCAPIMVKNK